jgi:hypothetical protein
MLRALQRRAAIEDVCRCEASGDGRPDGSETKKRETTTARRHVTNSLISP